MAQNPSTRTSRATRGACAIGATFESETMSTTTTTTTLAIRTGDFLPTINKSGKVTATAEKVAQTLNAMSAAAVLGAALTSKGAIGKQATARVASQAVTLDSLLALDALDGGQWGDLFALLRGAYGVADYNRATQRGRAGALAYMDLVRVSLVQRFDRAETVKAQDNAFKAVEAFDVVHAQVLRLSAAADAAAAAARDAETAALTAAADAAAAAARDAAAAARDAETAALTAAGLTDNSADNSAATMEETATA